MHIVDYIVPSLFLVCHLILVIRFIPELNRSVIFPPWAKGMHYVLIWLIPFAWVMLLKKILKSKPGSWKIQDKQDYEPWSSPDDFSL